MFPVLAYRFLHAFVSVPTTTNRMGHWIFLIFLNVHFWTLVSVILFTLFPASFVSFHSRVSHKYIFLHRLLGCMCTGKPESMHVYGVIYCLGYVLGR